MSVCAQFAAQGSGQRPTAARCVATGWPALDELLPGGGLPAGALTELLEEGDGPASGAWAGAARMAARAGKPVVWVDGGGDFFPPAAVSLGLDLRSLLVIRPARPHDALWAFDQAIRCGDVAASVAAIPRLTMPILRRLQLAAAAGGGLALLVRPGREGADPSAAAVRLRVGARADGGCAVEVVKARGGWRTGAVLLDTMLLDTTLLDTMLLEADGDGTADPLLLPSAPVE